MLGLGPLARSGGWGLIDGSLQNVPVVGARAQLDHSEPKGFRLPQHELELLGVAEPIRVEVRFPRNLGTDERGVSIDWIASRMARICPLPECMALMVPTAGPQSPTA